MEQEHPTSENNKENVELHKDPALIPKPVYNAEHKEIATHTNMFAGSNTLDRALSTAVKGNLTNVTESLSAIISDARNEINGGVARRTTLVGKGFRNYGFMIASNQSINNFPQFAPNFFDTESFNEIIEDYLFLRDMSERFMGMAGEMRDIMNIVGNLGYDFSLAYYANIRSIAKRTGNQTATNIFNILRRFFSNRRGAATIDIEGEPTMKKLEHDIHSLIKGRKDGEIVIKNRKPVVSGKVHEVIDDTYKPTHEEFKETISGIVCSKCGTENQSHAKFCINCGARLM